MKSFARLVATLVVSLGTLSAGAVTTTASGIWPAAQVPSLFTNINGPANGQQTSFTGYVSGPYHYVLYPFTVAVSGTYTATSTTTNVLNTTWFLDGVFSPSNTAPATPLSSFIVAVLAANTTPKVGSFTGVTLTAGQQYSVVVAFNSGSTSGDLSTVTMTGPGCVLIGSNTCLPNEPTAATAVGGNAQATVSFTPPTFDGGVAITSYTVTSSPAGITASGAASPITVSGLTNGTPYTFTVTATNAVGTGLVSLPTNTVVPTATSFTGPTATGTGGATVSISGGGPGCTFAPAGTGAMQSAFFIPVSGSPKSPPAGSAPPGVVFPHGLLDFVLTGCAPGSTVTFTVTWPSALPAGTAYYKYGPTAATPAAHWYLLPATVSGNVATFSITDGGLGDDDLAANGSIVDQGGPGIPPSGAAVSVPTLSEWAMMLMAALMVGTGVVGMRRPR